MNGTPGWRAFPWDRRARPGKPFSPAHVPPGQGAGRFDLADSPVLYLAETPDHAIGEKIARFRGTALRKVHLQEFGHPLALVEVSIPVGPAIADLCDPEVLVEVGAGPDEIAARSRETTRSIARRLFDAGYAGLRWWSAFFGQWHGVVLFLERLGDEPPTYEEPTPVDLSDPTLQRATELLGIPVTGG